MVKSSTRGPLQRLIIWLALPIYTLNHQMVKSSTRGPLQRLIIWLALPIYTLNHQMVKSSTRGPLQRVLSMTSTTNIHIKPSDGEIINKRPDCYHMTSTTNIHIKPSDGEIINKRPPTKTVIIWLALPIYTLNHQMVKSSTRGPLQRLHIKLSDGEIIIWLALPIYTLNHQMVKSSTRGPLQRLLSYD